MRSDAGELAVRPATASPPGGLADGPSSDIAGHAASGVPGATPGAPARRGFSLRSLERGLGRIGNVQAQGLVVFYVVVLVYFWIASNAFFTLNNFRAILASAAVIGIVSVGQTLAIIAGGFDLSVAGVLPLGAVCYAELTNRGLPVALATVLVVLIGAGIGLGNGIVIAVFRISPLITTLATLSITSGLALTLTNGQTLVLSSPAAGVWGNSIGGGIQGGVILLIGLAVVTAAVLSRTVWGRSLYAVGGNREASRLAGVNVRAMTISVYAAAAGCAGLAGAVAAGQLLAAAPSIGTDDALISIAAVVLGGASLSGGAGRVSGTLLGVLLIGTINDGMSLIQVASFYQTIATGAILLVAVLFGRLREATSATSKE